jgi:alkaline phosphatase
MINSGLDLLFAGGSEFVSKKRKDGFDLSKDIQELGYKYITTEAAMRTVTEPKVIGLFAPVAMMSEMDRRESGGSAEPSLAEMTQKAIDILSKNPKGFVLMVEGSKVDWAAHSHEPVGLVSEILAFNAALKAAADFAEKRGDTLILVCTDHGNGGVTVGPSEARGGPEAGVKLLQSIKITGAALAGKIAAIPEPSAEKIQALVREQWKISLDDAETAKILDSLAPAAERKNKSHESMESILGAALSRRTGVCWATPSHSGEDVTLRACGAGGKSFGLVNNTDIPKIAAAALGLDMSKTSSELFVEAHPAFLKKWAHAEEIKDVDGSPVTLIVTKGSDKLTLRVNSALCDFNGKKIRLPGPVIYTGVKLYVPAAALALIPESKAAPSPAAATAR